jgi:hypothetical protein
MTYLILSFLISTAAAMLAYTQARRFVARRLRYVDAVQRASAPWLAGLAAGALALPLVALLPLVGVGTALTIAVAVGAGVAAGARAIRRLLPRY